MQSLPDLAPARREHAARNYLAHAARGLNDKTRDDILAQVLKLLDDPRFSALFGPGSRAEVPLIGRLIREEHKPVPVSGQVDRLVMNDESILIADYKTNHAPPRDLDEAIQNHSGYVLQLALYRALLASIRPGLPVRAALLWTENADLMEIPGTALDAALLRLS